MNPKLKFIIVVGLTCGLGISIGFFIFTPPQTSTVNGSSDILTLYKGEEYSLGDGSYAVYGGFDVQSAGWQHGDYFFNYWVHYNGGCGRIYFDTGDILYFEGVYEVTSVTDDKVTLTRVH